MFIFSCYEDTIEFISIFLEIYVFVNWFIRNMYFYINFCIVGLAIIKINKNLVFNFEGFDKH